jgi:hypothetical protein
MINENRYNGHSSNGAGDSQPKTPLFELGRLLTTPGAKAALDEYPGLAEEFLSLHVTGDWGTLCPEDEVANNLAVLNGERILSIYYTPSVVKLYLITEWDRSATTFLLPEEY